MMLMKVDLCRKALLEVVCLIKNKSIGAEANPGTISLKSSKFPRSIFRGLELQGEQKAKAGAVETDM